MSANAPRFELQSVYDDGSSSEPEIKTVVRMAGEDAKMGRRGFISVGAASAGTLLAILGAGCDKGGSDKNKLCDTKQTLAVLRKNLAIMQQKVLTLEAELKNLQNQEQLLDQEIPVEANKKKKEDLEHELRNVQKAIVKVQKELAEARACVNELTLQINLRTPKPAPVRKTTPTSSSSSHSYSYCTCNKICTCIPVYSDRNAKAGFEDVDAVDIVARLSSIPVQRWTYKDDPSAAQHIGPMAQDFARAFGVGTDNKHIQVVDASGVALAAIQGLHKILQAQAIRASEQDQLIRKLVLQVARQGKALETLKKKRPQSARSARRLRNPRP